MARTRLQRLNRRQLRTLRNPLPARAVDRSIHPDKTAFLADEKAALSELRARMAPINVALGAPLGNKAIRDFAQQAAPYLAAQKYAVFQQQSGVKGDPRPLAVAYLGLDTPDVFGKAWEKTSPDSPAFLVAEEAVSEIMDAIEERRGAWETVSDDVEVIIADVPSSEPSISTAEADIMAFLAEPWQDIKDELDDFLSDLSHTDLLKAKKIEKGRKGKRKPRGKVLKAIDAALGQSYQEMAGREEKAARDERLAKAQGKRPQGSREAASVDADADLPSGAAEMLSRIGAAFGDLGDGTEEGFEEEDFDIEEDDEGEPTSAGGSGGKKPPPRPKRGAASEGADPGAIRAGRLVRAKKIRGAAQRAEARAERIKGFKDFMLPYRRPQAKARSASIDVPVLYAPPKDVLDKIEEIQAADSRKGLPRQFQDILIYVLTEDHAVGRGKVIPAGSVEVYNKGTLVGTIGRKPVIENTRNAMFYGGWLVGLDLRERKFEASKASRMDSRIYYAAQGVEGFSLVAPSLNEVLRESPARIEVDLEESKREALGGLVANPRTTRHQVGNIRFKPTRSGYQVLNGPLKGCHYTTSDFGHGCKLAMLLDITRPQAGRN